jgi:hypothetical protein
MTTHTEAAARSISGVRWLPALVALFALLAAPSSARAQGAAPTLDETWAWILEQVPQLGYEEDVPYKSGPVRMSNRQHLTRNGKCGVMLTKVTTGGGIYDGITLTEDFALSSMSPHYRVDVEAGAWKSTVGRVYRLALIATQGTPVKARSSNGYQGQSAEVHFHLMDQSLADRLGRAFSHAIRQCASPF